MMQPKPSLELQIYLGINNEQKGPFSSAQILEMIENGKIPQDALIWHEGFKDWQPITSIEDFKNAFSKIKAAALDTLPNVNSIPKKMASLNSEKHEGDATFKPIFSDAKIAKNPSLKQYFLPFILVVIGVGLSGISYFVYLYLQKEKPITQIEKSPSPPVKRIVQNAAETDLLKRKSEYEDALANINVKPQDAITVLEKLLEENLKDEIGQKSAELLINHYKQKRNYNRVGSILLKLGKAEEAYSTFMLSEPPMYHEAEQALFEAINSSSNSKQKELLFEDIRLLLGPLNNTMLAIERIKLFEKKFKGERHPFGYYLKSEEERINELFKRLAFYFVNKLLAHIDSEFPQMSLTKRPTVSVSKIKTTNKYHIVGSYTGDITLAEDVLSDINMTFWFWNERWFLVSTNLTPERSKWAQKEKENLKEIGYNVHDMLAYLEGTFKYQFPKFGLHEDINQISILKIDTDIK